MNHCASALKYLMAKRLAIMCCLGFWVLPSFAAEQYALLVGVSNYPHLEEQFQLKGSTNDVALIRQVLLEKGFADNHIHILADGLTDKMPTRKNILAALKNLTGQVKAQDFVFLHFSGHGSQQPVSSTDKTHYEPDGLDEIFLPRDVGNWIDETGTVKNAIVDDELNQYLTAWRNKGAYSWVVFDSCHSGTMTRGISKTDIRERRIPPHALGIPAQALAQDSSRAISRGVSRGVRGSLSRRLNSTVEMPLYETHSATEHGNYVAFYAAQTTETTPEMPLPVTHPEKRSYGLFTYTLAEVLMQYDDITYRQAGQLILQRYAAQNHFNQTPSFEGTLIDAPIFGTQRTQQIPQWRIQHKIKRLQIAAGQLHGLAAGSILAILPNSAASDEAILGYLQITRADISASLVKSIAYNEKPVLAITDIPQGAYAKLVEPKVSLTLHVALPPEPTVGTKLKAQEIQARQVLTKLIQSKNFFGINLTWVPTDAYADLYLLFKDDQLWLLPPTGELIETGAHKTHSISLNTTETDLHDKLVNSLQAIAKVSSLLRISQHAPRGLFAKQILINAYVEHARQSIDFKADKIPSLFEGNIITLSVDNQSPFAADVTILFIDSEYGITTMYPAEYGEINRIEAGGNDWLEIELYADTTGIERLIVIAVQAQPNEMTKDFSFLAQSKLPRTRSGSEPNLHELFLDAGFGVQEPDTKGAKTSKRLNQTVIKMFSWKMSSKNTKSWGGESRRGVR